MITEEPIRVEETMAEVMDPTRGGVASFLGVVRAEREDNGVISIFYDCYREMTVKEIGRIIDEISDAAVVLRIVHRIGEVPTGEASLLVVAAAPHRREAFDAVQRAVDEIKRRLPIWKKEKYADETAKWI